MIIIYQLKLYVMKTSSGISRMIAMLIFTFYICIFGCSISDENKPQEILQPELNYTTLTTNPALLEGEWEWQWSTVFFTASGRPSRLYAEDAEYSERLVFTVDSVFIYRSDEPVKNYAFVTENSRLQFGDRSPEFLFGVNEEKLVLSTVYVDGSEKVYLRIRE